MSNSYKRITAFVNLPRNIRARIVVAAQALLGSLAFGERWPTHLLGSRVRERRNAAARTTRMTRPASPRRKSPFATAHAASRTCIPTFELSPATLQKLAEPTRPSRRRAGPRSTNTRDAAVAEATNRPAKKNRR
jgi:hypothetical protein